LGIFSIKNKKYILSFSRSPVFGLENLQDEKMTSFKKNNLNRGLFFSFFFLFQEVNFWMLELEPKVT
jgi:hypothetical protein